MGNKSKVSLKILEKKADELNRQLKQTREAISKNESALKRKLSQKQRLDDELNALLRRRFSSEKSALSRVRRSSEKTEHRLGKRILALKRITKIYEVKKRALLQAKRRHAALEKQLEKMEKQVWE